MKREEFAKKWSLEELRTVTPLSGYGKEDCLSDLNEVIKYELSLPPAEGAEGKKTCVLCTKPAMDNGLCFEHNVCNVPKQPQPTAEGAEEINKSIDQTKDSISKRYNKSYWAVLKDHHNNGLLTTNDFIDELMIEFATIHAQRIAEKMVEEKLKDMAMGILMARDAFVRDDFDEVWHCLYKIASPNFDKIEPWDELEKIAGYIKP